MRSLATVPFLALALASPPLFAEQHPVYSLVDNRPLAHLERRGGLYLDAGGVGMAKYVHFSRPLVGWKLRAVEDGRKVALAQSQATLEVPLTAAQAAGKVVHLGLKAPASTVRILVGGKSSAAAPLKAGWQVVSVTLPDGALKEGENTLRLNFANFGTFGGQKAAAAVEMIQIGGTAPTAAEAKAQGLVLPADGGAAWYAFVPDGGALVAQGNAGACKVTLHATAHGAGSVDAELKLDGSAVDLSKLGKRFARVSLTAAGNGCAGVTLTRADLLAAGPAPARVQPKPPKNVIVWLTDDTRADRYHFYNSKSRVETPVFDEWAKKSTVFRVAYTQGNESRVSHASIWTSMYPGVHQMISEKAKLDPKFVTLAEAVKPSGRFCAGVMGNGFIDKFWGFGDGWDFLRNNIHDLPAHGLSADAIFADAKAVLDKEAGKPLFLYIGTIDSHVSWRAHEPWLSKYDPAAYSGNFVKACTDPQEEKIVLGKLAVSERDKERIRALYDSDVSYNDAVLGKLFDELKKRNMLDDTMVIMTSDHGEEFWDHGKIGHGQSLREELVHVPFFIYYPPLFPAGKVVDEGIDVLDILPTITDALGVPTPDAVQGESLVPLAEGIGAGYPRPAIASQYELAHTMRLDRYKLWVGGSGDVHLYDAAADPHEDHDLADSRPVERRALTDALGTWMALRNQWKKRKWGVASNLAPGFAAEMDK